MTYHMRTEMRQSLILAARQHDTERKVTLQLALMDYFDLNIHNLRSPNEPAHEIMVLIT